MYRILTHRAHCGHQYELWKLPYKFTCVTGLNSLSDYWDYEVRPIRDNVEFKSKELIDFNNYDFAIIHFDEFMVDTPKHQLLKKWSECFNWFLKTPLPKVAICHGTPQYKEFGDFSFNNYKNKIAILDHVKQKTVGLLKDILVICNSYQAQKEWGFHKSKVIWQGFDPNEFKQTNYNWNIISIGEESIKGRPHYNGFFAMRELKNSKLPEIKINPIIVKNPLLIKDKNPNLYAVEKFKNYINVLSNSCIYINPTMYSPMPRCRGEAMMCGLITVSIKNHDIDMFIKKGDNGFYSEDAKELSDFLNFLYRNKNKQRIINNIGLKSRETAIKYFHIDRFLSDWKNTTQIL